jgi:hypothetical protein
LEAFATLESHVLQKYESFLSSSRTHNFEKDSLKNEPLSSYKQHKKDVLRRVNAETALRSDSQLITCSNPSTIIDHYRGTQNTKSTLPQKKDRLSTKKVSQRGLSVIR